jgi:hypothetical protein
MLRTLIVCLALTALGAPNAVAAEQQPPQAAAVEAESPPADAGGCPGKANGAPCCTTCQDKRAQGISAEEQGGGCPCQRARKAREAASKKAQ